MIFHAADASLSYNFNLSTGIKELYVQEHNTNQANVINRYYIADPNDSVVKP
jgi:hypothetical protein